MCCWEDFDSIKLMEIFKLCSTCKEFKPLDAFCKRSKAKDGLQSRCKDCSAQYYVTNYLDLHPCVDCGERDPLVLDFDHVRGIKLSGISNMMWSGWSVKSLLEEIEKCDVRCANCHRRKTAKQFGWYKAEIGESGAKETGLRSIILASVTQSGQSSVLLSREPRVQISPGAR